MEETTTFLIVNIVGGILVLGSYLVYISQFPQESSQLWGGVSKKIQRLIVPFMFLAAGGYLLTGWWFWQTIDPEFLGFAGNLGYTGIITLFGIFLGFSTAWIPTAIKAIQTRSTRWKITTYGVLIVVSISCLIILFLICTATVETSKSPIGKNLAIIGWCFLCFQTVILDGLFWVIKFQPDKAYLVEIKIKT